MNSRFIRFRIYGKELNRWTNDEGRFPRLTQIELAYREYDSDFRLVNEGSEDFSARRYKQIVKKYVWIWDGTRRNKGGYRWFQNMGLITYNRKDSRLIKEYCKQRFDAEIVELR